MNKLPMIALAMLFALGSTAFAQGAGGGAGGAGAGAGAGGGNGPAAASGQGASSTTGMGNESTTGMGNEMTRPNRMQRPMTSPSAGESSQGNVGPGTNNNNDTMPRR